MTAKSITMSTLYEMI